MCLMTKYRQKKVDEKLGGAASLIMWKAMKVILSLRKTSSRIQLTGVYNETHWCKYKKGKNVNKYPEGKLPFFKIDKQGKIIRNITRLRYQSGFHAFFKKEDAENLRDWLKVDQLNPIIKVVPITVKREDIIHIGEGQKRSIDRYGRTKDGEETIPVAVIGKFHLKKKDYEKDISD